MTAEFRRTHFLTDRSIQWKYMGLTFFILVAFFSFSIAVVYFTGWAHLVTKLSQVYPQGRLVMILRLIYLRLGIGFGVILAAGFAATLFLSHTVAGPLVRIKRYLRLMAKGEFDLAPLALRRFDELKEVADLINEITSRLGPRLQERKKLVDSLQTTVQALRTDLQRMPSAGQEIHRKVNFLHDTLRVLE